MSGISRVYIGEHSLICFVSISHNKHHLTRSCSQWSPCRQPAPWHQRTRSGGRVWPVRTRSEPLGGEVSMCMGSMEHMLWGSCTLSFLCLAVGTVVSNVCSIVCACRKPPGFGKCCTVHVWIVSSCSCAAQSFASPRLCGSIIVPRLPAPV